MTDSQFLYQIMLRANAMRACAATASGPTQEQLLASVGRIMALFEKPMLDVSDARDCCIEVAAGFLRLAVERIGHHEIHGVS
jgi:hypothetical protein